jgi:UDP-N-acetylglucosamine:LPS N-acetylglucosamine transferase
VWRRPANGGEDAVTADRDDALVGASTGADAIRERQPEAHVVVVDGLQAAGRGAQAIARNGMETVLERAPALYDAQYWLIARFRPTRRLGGALAIAVGARGLLAVIERERPEVIVSTYPGSTEVLGRLRRSGRVKVPCVSAITDLAALRWWAHPGIDLHLITHAQSRPEVQAIAGPGADVRHVRGFTRAQFETPPESSAARSALGLPTKAPVVVVSGGGWGVGDLDRAARTALAIPNLTVVCLCGGNAKLRDRLQRDFKGERRVRVEGFTSRMCEWLAAADVLVHSTAGLTMLEAELCGTWAVSFGWGVGHIRVNNRAYRSSGLAAVATTPVELAAALREGLVSPRPRPDWYAALPPAADATLELLSRASRPAAR